MVEAASHPRPGPAFPRGLSVYLDALRFGAAMLVLFGHARLHAFGAGAIPGGLDAKIVSLIGGLAHAGVIVFFVVSGYLVGGKLINAVEPGARFAANYAIDRISRIYTVAIPALIFGFLVSATLDQVFGYAFKLTPGACEPAFLDLIPGVLLLHQSFSTNICFNGPVWSLHYEVYYYALFGALSVAALATEAKLRWGAVILAVAMLAYGLPEPFTGKGYMFSYATIWILGAAIAQPQPLGKGRPIILTAGAVVLVLAFMALERGEAISDGVLTFIVASSLLLVRRFDLPPWLTESWIGRFMAAGAAFSFSLYMFHAPMMNLARTIAELVYDVELAQRVLNAKGLVAWTGFIAVGLVGGLIGYVVFERRTTAVRQRMKAAWAAHQAKASAKASLDGEQKEERA